MRGPVLYYAAGGGLGHVSRALAVLSAAALPADAVRVLATGEYAPVASGKFPCPVDIVPAGAMTSRGAYDAFLDAYLSRGAFGALVIDTFPAGIVGEWARHGREIPRFLVARSVKWDSYRKRVGPGDFPRPLAALAVEPLDEGYHTALGKECRVTFSHGPVLYREESGAQPMPAAPRCLVVHSGPVEERRALMEEAALRFPGLPVDTAFPGDGPSFPASSSFGAYSRILSGAGYNMAGEALLAPSGRTHVLLPFPRRYDDQEARLRLLNEGRWFPRAVDGSPVAGRWLSRVLEFV